jgi:hypothetical protein
MRTNFATAETPADEPAVIFSADAGGARDTIATPLNISDTTTVVIEMKALVRGYFASWITAQSENHVVTLPTVEACLDASGDLGIARTAVPIDQSGQHRGRARLGSVDAPLSATIGCGFVIWQRPAANSRSCRLSCARLYLDESQTGDGRGDRGCANRQRLAEDQTRKGHAASGYSSVSEVYSQYRSVQTNTEYVLS